MAAEYIVIVLRKATVDPTGFDLWLRAPPALVAWAFSYEWLSATHSVPLEIIGSIIALLIGAFILWIPIWIVIAIAIYGLVFG